MNYKITLSLIVFALVTSCATKVEFPVSRVAPGADISATVKKDGNDNYKINLKAQNLTSPERLEPAKKMYVV